VEAEVALGHAASALAAKPVHRQAGHQRAEAAGIFALTGSILPGHHGVRASGRAISYDPGSRSQAPLTEAAMPNGFDAADVTPPPSIHYHGRGPR